MNPVAWSSTLLVLYPNGVARALVECDMTLDLVLRAVGYSYAELG